MCIQNNKGLMAKMPGVILSTSMVLSCLSSGFLMAGAGRDVVTKGEDNFDEQFDRILSQLSSNDLLGNDLPCRFFARIAESEAKYQKVCQELSDVRFNESNYEDYMVFIDAEIEDILGLLNFVIESIPSCNRLKIGALKKEYMEYDGYLKELLKEKSQVTSRCVALLKNEDSPVCKLGEEDVMALEKRYQDELKCAQDLQNSYMKDCLCMVELFKPKSMMH